MTPEVRRDIAFLESVGIRTRRSRALSPTFLKGVWLDGDTLVYNPNTLQLPADLFHEAGHLATTPSLFRPCITKAMNFGSWPPQFDQLIIDYINAHPDGLAYPEDPVYRGILQMGEVEAIAWSYAAMVAAGCDLDDYWKADARNFNGDAPGVRLHLDARAYLGIHGLQTAGMITVRTFPTMTRWLQV